MLLSAGMSVDQFWYGEPKIIRSYLISSMVNKTYDNQQNWALGIYFQNALAVVLGSMFSQKGSKELTYFEKPLKEFDYIDVEEETIEEKKDRIEDKQKTQYNYWAKLKSNKRNEVR